MTQPVFSWNADLGAQRSVKPTVQVTRFGDGYELRTTPVLNNTPQVWKVSFTVGPNEAKAILDFLEARKGSEAFLWTDPMGKQRTHVCREWASAQQQFGVYVVSASFEQVYEY